MPLLLLGKAMGVLTLLEDPATGIGAMYLRPGRKETPIKLAPSFDEAVLETKGELFERLDQTVRTLLGSDYLHRTKRDELQTELDHELELVEKQVGNPLHPRYVDTLDAVKRAEELLSARP